MKVALIVGSLRKDSYNLRLAQNIERLLPENAEADYVSVDLPLFSEDIESDPPKSVLDVAETVKSADLVMVISPEYNRSLPGGLKNLLDWLSRPCSDFALDGKVVAIGGMSTGPISTAVMQGHLRSILLQMNARVIGQPTLMMQASRDLDESGQLTPEARDVVTKFVGSAIEKVS